MIKITKVWYKKKNDELEKEYVEEFEYPWLAEDFLEFNKDTIEVLAMQSNNL